MLVPHRQHTDKMTPLSELAGRLPESAKQLQAILALREPPPTPAPPTDADRAACPVAVHFFLTPAQRDRVEQRLRELGGTRERALMRLVGEPV